MTSRSPLIATDFPPPSGQPPHTRFRAETKGCRQLTTRLCSNGAQSEVAFDLVLVKE